MAEITPFISKNEMQTKAFAKTLKSRFSSFKVFSLFGDLGSGKTTFVKGFLSSFQIDEKTVSSPTYSYVHTFQTDRFAIHHFDLYRLKNKDEFLKLGFEEYLENDICLIEWPDIIQSILPTNQTLFICLSFISSNTRKIEISHA